MAEAHFQAAVSEGSGAGFRTGATAPSLPEAGRSSAGHEEIF
jgi:hypothetical protein